MKRCLVTGAAGFVGANLARRLLHAGHEVHLILRPGFEDWRIRDVLDEMRVHSLDLTNENAVSEAVREARPDWVFHFASFGAYSWQTEFRRMVDVNILGAANLTHACLETGFESMVAAGSSSEYGFKDHPPTEAARLDPNSHYAVTKASATMFFRYTAQAQSARIAVLRLYSVYGPYENPGRFIPTLISKGLAGELPPLVNPDIARDFIYIDDVTDAFIVTAGSDQWSPGSIFNLATGSQTTIGEAVEIARKELNINQEPQWGSMPDRIWDTSVWVGDGTAIKEALGWAPQYSFADGFRKTVDWFRENPEPASQYKLA